MKKILFIVGILCVLLLIGGCIDKTEEYCSIFKHSKEYANLTIYMDNGICILSQENFTNVYYMECNAPIETANIIFKTTKALDNIPKIRWCKINEI